MGAGDAGAPLLEARRLRKAFRVQGQVVTALKDVSLRAEGGEFVSIIGPSGCGKSTLLNILCGLLQPDSGDILLHGRPERRRIGRVGYMPQRDLLLPWRTLLGNLVLGPEIMGRNLDAARREARELLGIFGLAGFEDAYPAALSGGMRQRAALLRTFLCRHELVLLDEPFGALDALTRRTMRGWLQEVWARFDQTVLLVTHDVEEAVCLSDRVVVLSPRPAQVMAEITVDLPRPRPVSPQEAFAPYERRLLALLGVSS